MISMPASTFTDPKCKDTNPKGIVGSNKLPFHLWPAVATAYGCLGLMNGAYKYGRNNFRACGVSVVTYVDAIQRHAARLLEGEEVDPDDGLPHLCGILASAAILADAEAAGVLVDDRNYHGAGACRKLDALTPHVARLKELHRHRNPKQWTYADNEKKDIRIEKSPQEPPQTHEVSSGGAGTGASAGRRRFSDPERTVPRPIADVYPLVADRFGYLSSGYNEAGHHGGHTGGTRD